MRGGRPGLLPGAFGACSASSSSDHRHCTGGTVERLSLCRTFALPDFRCAWYTCCHTFSEPPCTAHNPRALVRWTGARGTRLSPTLPWTPSPSSTSLSLWGNLTTGGRGQGSLEVGGGIDRWIGGASGWWKEAPRKVGGPVGTAGDRDGGRHRRPQRQQVRTQWRCPDVL